MTLKQALAALKRAGTAQNRKIYSRHGVSGDQYGVSFAELKKLKKAIGTDHELACGLWDTDNHDARVLATMIVDPDAFSSRELDSWARSLDNYVVTDAFSSVVAKSPHRERKFLAWKDRKGEWVATAAWNVFCALAMHEDDRPDAFFAEHLETVAAEIHGRPNRVRHSMNQAVICVGVRNASLRKKAEATAKRIGRVEVDHGETSCKTPDAAAYIEKTLAHRKKKG